MKPAIKRLYDEMSKIDKKIREYQKRCKHKNVIKTPKANTGNIFEENQYWTECRCPDCNRYWIIRDEDSEDDYYPPFKNLGE